MSQLGHPQACRPEDLEAARIWRLRGCGGLLEDLAPAETVFASVAEAAKSSMPPNPGCFQIPRRIGSQWRRSHARHLGSLFSVPMTAPTVNLQHLQIWRPFAAAASSVHQPLPITQHC